MEIVLKPESVDNLYRLVEMLWTLYDYCWVNIREKTRDMMFTGVVGPLHNLEMAQSSSAESIESRYNHTSFTQVCAGPKYWSSVTSSGNVSYVLVSLSQLTIALQLLRKGSFLDGFVFAVLQDDTLGTRLEVRAVGKEETRWVLDETHNEHPTLFRTYSPFTQSKKRKQGDEESAVAADDRVVEVLTPVDRIAHIVLFHVNLFASENSRRFSELKGAPPETASFPVDETCVITIPMAEWKRILNESCIIDNRFHVMVDVPSKTITFLSRGLLNNLYEVSSDVSLLAAAPGMLDEQKTVSQYQDIKVFAPQKTVISFTMLHRSLIAVTFPMEKHFRGAKAVVMRVHPNDSRVRMEYVSVDDHTMCVQYNRNLTAT